MGVTLRYPYEVRNEGEYFAGYRGGEGSEDMLDLAATSSPANRDISSLTNLRIDTRNL